ncbi:MAG: hypothetical protein R2862_07945 [Thermoanaerobaculia bacterium]
MRRTTAAAVLTLLLSQIAALPAAATCGGGGGGGTGGVNPGGMADAEIYRVPWKVLEAGATPQAGDSGLALLWFPLSREEARSSQLLDSRALTLTFAPCGGLFIVPSDDAALRLKYGAVDHEVAVLTGAGGAEISRTQPEKGKLRLAEVEKLVKGEVEKRRATVESKLSDAEDRAKSGATTEAAGLYREILAERCLLPGSARKAERALRKLGVDPGSAAIAPGDPDLSPETSAEMLALLGAGLAAEFELRLDDARHAYERAHETDPYDAVALRFLAEFHRHHSGDWEVSRQLFEELLSRPADALSRAVALHGLGKMTIHAGDFAGGVASIEASVEAYPLPLAYRNLAVYWNSEGRFDKAWTYVEKALALAPDDLYNKIFAATYFVGRGDRAAAERVATEQAPVLEASYNLAAIWAQLGNREKALEYLARHFYEYERFDPVRAREMREARDDIAFASLHADPGFVELTSLADADFDSYHLRGRGTSN